MTIAVVDYDCGNLFSIRQALIHCGSDVKFVSRPEDIAKAEKLILPGVGAFGDAMTSLKKRNMSGAISEYAAKGRPLLAICVGMQLLFDESEENPGVQGLGLIPGRVERIPAIGKKGEPHKVPFIGWSGITPPRDDAIWSDAPLRDLLPETPFYFVHSYTASPTEPSCVLATAGYNGLKICAAVKSENLLGYQFHPEKSGAAGLGLLSSFVSEAR